MGGPIRNFLRERKTIIERPRIFKPEETALTSFHRGGTIIEDVRIKGTLAEKEVSAMFDTGIHPCMITPKLAEEVGVREIEEVEMTTPFGITKVKEVELEEVEVKGKIRHEPRAVMTEGIPIDFLVGRDVMEWLDIKLDPREMKIIMNPGGNPNGLKYALTRPIEL